MKRLSTKTVFLQSRFFILLVESFSPSICVENVESASPISQSIYVENVLGDKGGTFHVCPAYVPPNKIRTMTLTLKFCCRVGLSRVVGLTVAYCGA
jgi:hypothetical protein